MRIDDFEAVVFDMDGVIFDTERLVLIAWQRVAKEHNITGIEAACYGSLGLTQTASEQNFKNHFGEDFPYKELKAECRELFYGELYGEHLPIKEGVEDFLKWLKSKGIKTAIASSTRTPAITSELKDANLFEYFDKIIGGDMVTNSKPDPEIFLLACKELGVAPEKAVGIEDSFNGIRALNAGGLYTIMVPDMLGPTDEIRDLSDKIFTSMKGVHEYLSRD